MPRLPGRAGLNETTQRELCWHLAQGASREEAARRAGLPDGTRLEHFARTKAFADELRTAMQDHLATNMAPRAVQVLRDILDDKNVNARVRVDAAKVILDRSGYASAEAAKPPAEKDVAELNLAQLQALVAKLEGKMKVVEHKPAEVPPAVTPEFME